MIATSVAPVSACAQGPVYRERWGYLHLENRRAEVFHELRGRSETDVAKVAEVGLDITRGTIYGPTRLGPFPRAMSKAAIMFDVDGPPEPTIRPVLGPLTSPGSRPASAIACSMAIYA